jgi:hypothetical protein
MISVIRIIFWSIVLIICFLIIKKSAVIKKSRWYSISFIVAFLLYSLSCWVPVENAFITFSSPESAFRYTNSGDVMLVVEGEESAWVLGDEFSDIIPKSGSRWKFSIAGDLNTIISDISLNGIDFSVDHYMDSDDYYITVTNPNGGVIDVTDNRNSKFFHIEKYNNMLDITYYIYYAYVHDLDDEYTLIVNGEVITVLDEQYNQYKY